MADLTSDHGHVPVLLDRCVELLTPALTRHDADGAGAVLVDATLGAGGHAERFLTELPGLRLIGLDRDPDALWIAGERLAPFGDRVLLVRTRYDGIDGALAESGYWASESGHPKSTASCSTSASRRCNWTAPSADSPTPHDAPLDMRMDPDAALTAAEILNTYDEQALARILREFGEERFAAGSPPRSSAGAPAARSPRTGELVELLYDAIPAPARRTGGHPAKRTFQALRIAVNGELDSLRDALPAALDALRPRRSHRGDGLPVAGGPHRQEPCSPPRRRPARRRACPSSYPATSRNSPALTRGAERAGADGDRTQPAKRVRCGFGHWRRLPGRDGS